MRAVNHKKFGGSPRGGFTIVELLVVIVVIAILTAITIVAYNGIQSRARGSKIVAALDVYEKTARLYKEENGVYPSSDDGFNVCLGDSYPATSLFAEGECYAVGGSSYQESQTTNDQFKTVVSNLPDVSDASVDTGAGGAIRGILYQRVGNEAIMTYYIAGDQPCGRGHKYPSQFGGKPITTCQVELE